MREPLRVLDLTLGQARLGHNASCQVVRDTLGTKSIPSQASYSYWIAKRHSGDVLACGQHQALVVHHTTGTREEHLGTAGKTLSGYRLGHVYQRREHNRDSFFRDCARRSLIGYRERSGQRIRVSSATDLRQIESEAETVFRTGDSVLSPAGHFSAAATEPSPCTLGNTILRSLYQGEIGHRRTRNVEEAWS